MAKKQYKSSAYTLKRELIKSTDYIPPPVTGNRITIETPDYNVTQPIRNQMTDANYRINEVTNGGIDRRKPGYDLNCYEPKAFEYIRLGNAMFTVPYRYSKNIKEAGNYHKFIFELIDIFRDQILNWPFYGPTPRGWQNNYFFDYMLTLTNSISETSLNNLMTRCPLDKNIYSYSYFKVFGYRATNPLIREISYNPFYSMNGFDDAHFVMRPVDCKGDNLKSNIYYYRSNNFAPGIAPSIDRYSGVHAWYFLDKRLYQLKNYISRHFLSRSIEKNKDINISDNSKYSLIKIINFDIFREYRKNNDFIYKDTAKTFISDVKGDLFGTDNINFIATSFRMRYLDYSQMKCIGVLPVSSSFPEVKKDSYDLQKFEHVTIGANLYMIGSQSVFEQNRAIFYSLTTQVIPNFYYSTPRTNDASVLIGRIKKNNLPAIINVRSFATTYLNTILDVSFNQNTKCKLQYQFESDSSVGVDFDLSEMQSKYVYEATMIDIEGNNNTIYLNYEIDEIIKVNTDTSLLYPVKDKVEIIFSLFRVTGIENTIIIDLVDSSSKKRNFPKFKNIHPSQNTLPVQFALVRDMGNLVSHNNISTNRVFVVHRGIIYKYGQEYIDDISNNYGHGGNCHICYDKYHDEYICASDNNHDLDLTNVFYKFNPQTKQFVRVP